MPPSPLICLAATFLITAPLASQSNHERDVLDVVAVMFDGLAQRDTGLMRTTLEPGVRLIQTFSRAGQPEHRVVPIDDLLANIGNQEGTRAAEPALSLRRFRGLAALLAPYPASPLQGASVLEP